MNYENEVDGITASRDDAASSPKISFLHSFPNNFGSYDSDDDFKSVADEDQNAQTQVLPARNLVTDLLTHLTDEEISDVILQGTDGRQVVAIRSILAMRSRFFKSLFFGDFSESKMATVPLGYSSLVLRAVVEYCYTDEIKVTFENLNFEETARSMVGLVAAGNYFELGGLLSRAYRLTCLMMDEYPALACSVLDEAISGENKGSHTEELSRVALGIIRLRTESALMPRDLCGTGVHSLGDAAMELVMSDKKIQTNELKLFHCLKKWSEHVPEGQNASAFLEQRQKVARKLASHIDFAKVAPSDLACVVADSGIVPLELLCSAYKAQALQAERSGIAFDRMRTVEHATNGRVMVQGAGLSAVNGTYVSVTTMIAQFQQYSKRGVLPGSGSGVFILRTLTMQDDTRKWLLSFRYKYEAIIDLYSAPVLFDEIIPPMQTWIPCLNAHEKLRSLASQSKVNHKRNNNNHTSIVAGESEESGNPPPICIWLPDDPLDS
jgi:BTB/POZ domain